jgi:ATP-binding cassette subfamily C protein
VSIKVLRLMLQSAVIGLGAYLAILSEVTPGAIIAGSVLLSRALAPIEIAIAHWRGFVAARQSYARLSHTLSALATPAAPTPLPAPAPVAQGRTPDDCPARVQEAHSQRLGFRTARRLGAGHCGPERRGQVDARACVVGIWSPLAGAVRFDGASLQQWDRDALGDHIGYLPQDVELFRQT